MARRQIVTRGLLFLLGASLLRLLEWNGLVAMSRKGTNQMSNITGQWAALLGRMGYGFC